jgi:glycosyltransferase involved in cell wall biosynthesis
MKLLQICFQTYNRYQFLKKNLEFLIEEIKRDKLKKEVEILVGDDKSDDKTGDYLLKISKKYPYLLKYYRNKKNLGLPANTFKMIEKAKGKYLWFLSDDDFIKKGSLKKIVENLKKMQPDSYFLDYSPVQTNIKKFSFKKIKSILAPGWHLRKNILIKNQKNFFKVLGNSGFYNFRMALAQQSLLITRSEILKNGLALVKKTGYDLTKEFYPLDLCHLINLKNKFFIDVKNKVMITVNNRGWNADILKANKVVRDYFDPMLFMILKKYRKEISLRGKFYILISPLYSRAVFLATLLFNF